MDINDLGKKAKNYVFHYAISNGAFAKVYAVTNLKYSRKSALKVWL